jgi:hypothetical protein
VVPLRFTPTVVVPEASRLLWTYIYWGGRQVPPSPRAAGTLELIRATPCYLIGAFVCVLKGPALAGLRTVFEQVMLYVGTFVNFARARPGLRSD